jgi:hypothetical protein
VFECCVCVCVCVCAFVCARVSLGEECGCVWVSKRVSLCVCLGVWVCGRLYVCPRACVRMCACCALGEESGFSASGEASGSPGWVCCFFVPSARCSAPPCKASVWTIHLFGFLFRPYTPTLDGNSGPNAS